jgi:hypothetical protein
MPLKRGQFHFKIWFPSGQMLETRSQGNLSVEEWHKLVCSYCCDLIAMAGHACIEADAASKDVSAREAEP